MLLLVIALLLVKSGHAESLIIGSKKFTESYVLAQNDTLYDRTNTSVF